jgi:hypothetical protein
MDTSPPPFEMGIAAGGLINQTIVEDPGMHKWDPSKTVVFNLQILNTHHFKRITGMEPPRPVIDAATYAAYGLPFYSLYEEPSSVAGDFEDIKSIGQLDGIVEPSVKATSVVAIPGRVDGNGLDDFYDASGPLNPFLSVRELEEMIRNLGINLF